MAFFDGRGASRGGRGFGGGGRSFGRGRGSFGGRGGSRGGFSGHGSFGNSRGGRGSDRGRGRGKTNTFRHHNTENITDTYGHSQGDIIDRHADRKAKRRAAKAEEKHKRTLKHEAYLEAARQRKQKKLHDQEAKQRRAAGKARYESQMAARNGTDDQQPSDANVGPSKKKQITFGSPSPLRTREARKTSGPLSKDKVTSNNNPKDNAAPKPRQTLSQLLKEAKEFNEGDEAARNKHMGIVDDDNAASSTTGSGKKYVPPSKRRAMEAASKSTPANATNMKNNGAKSHIFPPLKITQNATSFVRASDYQSGKEITKRKEVMEAEEDDIESEEGSLQSMGSDFGDEAENEEFEEVSEGSLQDDELEEDEEDDFADIEDDFADPEDDFADEEDDFLDEEGLEVDEDNFDDYNDDNFDTISDDEGSDIEKEVPTVSRSPLLSEAVVPKLKLAVRKLLNQIALSNVTDHTRTISDLFESNPRASVTAALCKAISENILITDIKLTFQNAMPTAALVRALQLLHGNLIGSSIIEYIVHTVEDTLKTLYIITKSLDETGEEPPNGSYPSLSAAESHLENSVIFLCAVASLHGFDVELVLSLMQLLINIATNKMTQPQKIRLGIGATQARRGFTGPALTEAFMSAVSGCALSLINTIGEQLRKAAPTQLNRSVEALRQATTLDDNDDGVNTQSTRTRQSVLLTLLKEVASGKRFKAPKKKMPKKKVGANDILLGGDEGANLASADPSQSIIEETIEALVDVLEAMNSGNKKAKLNRKVLRESVLTLNVLPALPWHYMARYSKGPKWYQGVSQSELKEEGEETAPKVKKAATKKIGEKRPRDNDDEEITSSDDNEESGDDEEAHAAAQLKRETIQRLRDEEKALSGQRFTSEIKRDIFKCITAASDEMEAFLALTNYDPDGNQSQDIAAVILHVACQDSVYRPFYAHVLQRLLSARKTFRKALQYALWDRFKQIRIAGGAPDITSYVNLASLISDLFEADLYGISLLRGLDLENIDKSIGLFTKILVLRLLVALSPKQLTALFFGGNVTSDSGNSKDLNVDTKHLRKNLQKFISLYFVDENEAKKWIPLLFEVVASGTPFDTNMKGAEDLAQLGVRIRVIHKALKQGI